MNKNEIPISTLDTIKKKHGERFANEMSPSILRFAKKLNRTSRRVFHEGLGSKYDEQRYQRFSEIAFNEYLSQHFDTVECPDNPADFYLPSEQCFLDVTTPGIGENQELKQFSDISITLRAVPTEAIILKYWDAILNKSKSFSKKIVSGAIRSDHANVIAVSPAIFSNHSLWGQEKCEYNYPAILKAVFPIGEPYIYMDLKTGEEGVGVGKKQSIPSINGVPRRKELFINKQHSHISATVSFFHNFNWFSPWNPIVVHNPFAKTPLRHGFFPNAIAEYTAEIEYTKSSLAYSIIEL